MSKTDTVAPLVCFSREKFIFRRTVQFARIFAATGRSLSLLKITTPQRARGMLGRGGALASAKFAHGVHAHGVQPCSEPQCSVAALPSSTSICARGEAQAVALSTRRAWLGRCAHCSAHIKCSRALSLCSVLKSLRRSHASQVESVQATAYSALGWREVRRYRRTGRECYERE